MEILEFFRKYKRGLDGYISYRKAFLLIVIIFGVIFYLGPILFGRWKGKEINLLDLCMNEKLFLFNNEVVTMDTNIQSVPIRQGFVPYVGNGLLSVHFDSDKWSSLYIKHGRILSLAVPYLPVISVSDNTLETRKSIAVQYINGIVHELQCIGAHKTFSVSSQLYAHRSIPAILYQDIKISNPTSDIVTVSAERSSREWPLAESSVQKISSSTLQENNEFIVNFGYVETSQESDVSVIPVAIVTSKVQKNVLEIKAHGTFSFQVITAVNYTDPIPRERLQDVKAQVIESALKELNRVLSYSSNQFKQTHVDCWRELWTTGFGISYSKAANALNGDKINATMYYVLSQVRAPLWEAVGSKNAKKRAEINGLLSYSEGCYSGGHHTLQARNLWSNLENIQDVNVVVQYWILTLEKMGCHNLLRAGANGVIQGMVLSFGNFKFSNQHLEFNTQPMDLHRDYFFRRLMYGNASHVNVSVVVQEDNKAVLFVALDGSDTTYYACDAGCLDPAVQLSPEYSQFPVKLTSPITAILYITSDKQHMEELKHTIHVHEVKEAPAHEHHVIALHKHGYQLGGLPAVFWVSISFLIIMFHLFLFKLIYNEYYGTPEKYRSRTKILQCASRTGKERRITFIKNYF